jgi:spermidine synthase
MDILINNVTSDKNTVHSYLPIYTQFLAKKKDTAKNVMEVGVNEGGSIQLWRDYFTNASVWAVDIVDNVQPVHVALRSDPRVKLLLHSDAYNTNFVDSLSNVKFDFILDDGPHTLESMIFFVKNYSKLLTDDGCLIIEDVQCITWMKPIFDAVPDELKPFCRQADLRTVKGRYDDIMFIIDKA